jgi:hypothetical protein
MSVPFAAAPFMAPLRRRKYGAVSAFRSNPEDRASSWACILVFVVGCAMDLTMQLRRLDEAERHIAHGTHNMIVEEKRITKMDRDGQDTTHARSLLVVFKNLHQQHVEHRDRIVRASN